jgi:hypothetical protein
MSHRIGIVLALITVCSNSRSVAQSEDLFDVYRSLKNDTCFVIEIPKAFEYRTAIPVRFAVQSTIDTTLIAEVTESGLEFAVKDPRGGHYSVRIAQLGLDTITAELELLSSSRRIVLAKDTLSDATLAYEYGLQVCSLLASAKFSMLASLAISPLPVTRKGKIRQIKSPQEFESFLHRRSVSQLLSELVFSASRFGKGRNDVYFLFVTGSHAGPELTVWFRQTQQVGSRSFKIVSMNFE